MTLWRLIALLHATLEPRYARVLIQMPDGSFGLVRGVTSKDGEVIIQATMDVREELRS